jgi:transposase
VILQTSHTTIARWLKQPNRPTFKPRAATSKSYIIVETIKSAIKNDPFVSLAQMRAIVQRTFNLTVSKECIRTVLKRSGMTKKNAKIFGSPPDLEQKTQAFLKERDRFRSEGRYFVSMDETSFGRNGKHSRGYSLKGQALIIKKQPARMTTVSSLCIMDGERIVARQERIGSFNSTLTATFLESLELPRQTVILLDNVAFHKSKIVKELALKREWTLLYTPPYSPWFNPIEGAFSIIKRRFYTGCGIEKAFNALESSHCKAFLKQSLESIGQS